MSASAILVNGQDEQVSMLTRIVAPVYVTGMMAKSTSAFAIKNYDISIFSYICVYCFMSL